MSKLLENEAKLAIENQTKFWAQLDIPIHFSHEKTQVASGIPHPLFNFVLRTNFSSSLAGKRVEETIRQFEKLQLPFCWLLDDASTPSNLKEYLISEGLEEIEQMSLLLCDLKGSCKGKDSLLVKAVGDKKTMGKWTAVIQKGYGISEKNAKRYTELLTTGEIKPLRHFLFEKEGRVTGAATLFFLPQTAGIYNLTAISPSEEKEVFEAMVAHLIVHSKRICRRFLSLHLPNKKAEWLKPLGFEEIKSYSLYSERKRSSR